VKRQDSLILWSRLAVFASIFLITTALLASHSQAAGGPVPNDPPEDSCQKPYFQVAPHSLRVVTDIDATANYQRTVGDIVHAWASFFKGETLFPGGLVGGLQANIDMVNDGKGNLRIGNFDQVVAQIKAQLQKYIIMDFFTSKAPTRIEIRKIATQIGVTENDGWICALALPRLKSAVRIESVRVEITNVAFRLNGVSPKDATVEDYEVEDLKDEPIALNVYAKINWKSDSQANE